MAKIHRNRRRDEAEAAIVKALQQVGASVTLLDATDGDGGVPDLLVGRHGKTYLLEVKEPLGPRGGGGGKLTPAQVKWWRRWKGAAPVVVRDPGQALLAIGVILATTWGQVKQKLDDAIREIEKRVPSLTWREVLSDGRAWPEGLDPADMLQVVKGRYRNLIANAHPDRGGDQAIAAALGEAMAAAEKELG